MHSRRRHGRTVAALALAMLIVGAPLAAIAQPCPGGCPIAQAMTCCEPEPGADAPTSANIRAVGCCDDPRPVSSAHTARGGDASAAQSVGEQRVRPHVASAAQRRYDALIVLARTSSPPKLAAAPPAPPGVRTVVLLL